MASQTTIQVDAAAAEVIRRADAFARANGQTLASYLQRVLPSEAVKKNGAHGPSQTEVWDAFVSRMTSLVAATVRRCHLIFRTDGAASSSGRGARDLAGNARIGAAAGVGRGCRTG